MLEQERRATEQLRQKVEAHFDQAKKRVLQDVKALEIFSRRMRQLRNNPRTTAGEIDTLGRMIHEKKVAIQAALTP